MAIIVRQVQTEADFKAFFEFPWKLYQDYPCWVAELPSLRRESLDKKKHAAWEYMTGEYFVAYRNDEPAGTIAAVVNHRHNEIHGENIGFFGFFECVDDQAVAGALFEAAEDYLRSQKVEAVRGPANFTSNEMYGLLIKGFDRTPMVLMPYNPEYYIRLLENAGFTKAMDLLSWKSDMEAGLAHSMFEADGVTETRLVKTTRKNNERRGIEIRTINMKEKRQEFELLKEMYNSAWEKNWGFLPMTERELDELVESLGMLLLPDFTYFGFVKGKPAGFLLLVPNMNDVFHHVKPHPGKPEAWWYLKTAWHWKIRPKIKSMRAILMGVKEEFRGLGVDAALHLAYADMIIKKYRHSNLTWAEAGWVLESNTNTNRLLQHFGCDDHRHHRIYQKTL